MERADVEALFGTEEEVAALPEYDGSQRCSWGDYIDRVPYASIWCPLMRGTRDRYHRPFFVFRDREDPSLSVRGRAVVFFQRSSDDDKTWTTASVADADILLRNASGHVISCGQVSDRNRAVLDQLREVVSNIKRTWRVVASEVQSAGHLPLDLAAIVLDYETPLLRLWEQRRVRVRQCLVTALCADIVEVVNSYS